MALDAKNATFHFGWSDSTPKVLQDATAVTTAATETTPLCWVHPDSAHAVTRWLGYSKESPQSYTRANKSRFGVIPSTFKDIDTYYGLLRQAIADGLEATKDKAAEHPFLIYRVHRIADADNQAVWDHDRSLFPAWAKSVPPAQAGYGFIGFWREAPESKTLLDVGDKKVFPVNKEFRITTILPPINTVRAALTAYRIGSAKNGTIGYKPRILAAPGLPAETAEKISDVPYRDTYTSHVQDNGEQADLLQLSPGAARKQEALDTIGAMLTGRMPPQRLRECREKAVDIVRFPELGIKAVFVGGRFINIDIPVIVI